MKIDRRPLRPLVSLWGIFRSVRLVTIPLFLTALALAIHLSPSYSFLLRAQDSLDSGARQSSQDDILRQEYGVGQIFETPGNDKRVQIDLAGFELTNDGYTSEGQIFMAGSLARRMLATADVDTLYEDLEPLALEYLNLWWYFYSQDSSNTLSQLKTWEENGQAWSSHTIEQMYGIDVNERHYDLFEINDGYIFHVTIKRPLYLEGDSTLMISTLRSFKVLPSDSTSEN